LKIVFSSLLVRYPENSFPLVVNLSNHELFDQQSLRQAQAERN